MPAPFSVRVTKIAGTVLLLAALGADLGLRSAAMLACATSERNSYVWCPTAARAAQSIDQWIMELFRGLKATDILLVVLTLMLVGVGRGQLKIYRQIRRDGALQNRAFVAVGEMKYAPVFAHSSPGDVISWQIWPIWTNSGNTRTRNQVNSVNWQVMIAELPSTFDFPEFYDQPSVKMLIGPRQMMNGHRITIPLEYIAAIKLGLVHVYVWGWTEYNEVFSRKRRRTEFSNEVSVLGDPFNPVCEFSFVNNPKFNGADDDCDRKPGAPAPVRAIPLGPPVPTLPNYAAFSTLAKKRFPESEPNPPEAEPKGDLGGLPG